jgi:acetyl esterase/lipase
MDDLLEDISNALAAIRNKAQDHGITLNKLVIVGHSLGGFLALNYGYRFFDQDPPIPIAFCVTMAGLSDLGDANWISLARNPFHWISFKTILLLASSLSGQAIPRDAITNFGFTEPVLEILKEISPRYAIREGIPPTIIVHDAADTIVPYSNATSLNGALDAMRVPNILISTSNYLNHGLSSNPLRETRVIRPSLEERMIQAIDQYLSLYGN